MRELPRVFISLVVSMIVFTFVVMAGFPVVGMYFGLIVLFQLFGFSLSFIAASVFLFFLADIYQYLPLGRHAVVLYGILFLYMYFASKTRIRVIGFVFIGLVYVLLELLLRALSLDEFIQKLILNCIWILIGWVVVRGLNVLRGSSVQLRINE